MKKLPVKSHTLTDGEKSMVALHERAEQIRQEGKRDKEGAYLPRYPGLIRPNMTGFNRREFRTSLMDIQSKLDKWISFKKASKLLGVDRDALIANIERLTWYGLAWNAGDKRAALRLRNYRDGETADTFVIHTADGGQVIAYMTLVVS